MMGRAIRRYSIKEKDCMVMSTPIPRLPFIPEANYRVFWIFPIRRGTALLGQFLTLLLPKTPDPTYSLLRR